MPLLFEVQDRLLCRWVKASDAANIEASKVVEAQLMRLDYVVAMGIYILRMCYVLMRAFHGNSELHGYGVMNLPRSESRSAI